MKIHITTDDGEVIDTYNIPNENIPLSPYMQVDLLNDIKRALNVGKEKCDDT